MLCRGGLISPRTAANPARHLNHQGSLPMLQIRSINMWVLWYELVSKVSTAYLITVLFASYHTGGYADSIVSLEGQSAELSVAHIYNCFELSQHPIWFCRTKLVTHQKAASPRMTCHPHLCQDRYHILVTKCCCYMCRHIYTQHAFQLMSKVSLLLPWQCPEPSSLKTRWYATKASHAGLRIRALQKHIYVEACIHKHGCRYPHYTDAA